MQLRIGLRFLRALGVVLIALLVALLQDNRAGVHAALSPTASYSQANLISNSQFVYGPAAQRFDLAGYLARAGSPLAADAPTLEAWCGYASVNPQVVLVLLELDGRQVTNGWHAPLPAGQRDADIGALVVQLAERFYAHLYRYGERAPSGMARTGSSVAPAAAGFAGVSSGTYALVASLGQTLAPAEFERAVAPTGMGSFAATWARLFPGSDPLDASVSITPDALPPADLFQFPFPIGQTWWFNGAHSWNGGGLAPPYSSMDFFTTADSCAAPPAGDWAVAAAGGSGYYPNTGAPCWYRIDHAGGWTTSYYHLRNVVGKGPAAANGRIGTIGCETCVGGYATGPHVHFSLLYNGAYVGLEGVKLSGWTVHTGSGNYDSGSLERDGVILRPYASVRNDGILSGTPTPTLTPSRTPTATPTPTRVPSATPTSPAAPAARYLYPPAQGLLRVCPVTLIAQAEGTGGVREVKFLARWGGALRELGTDTDGTDGWKLTWDCQDAPDGAATLSLSAWDMSGQEVLADAAATAVTISKACTEGTYRTAFFANPTFSGSPASSWCKASSIRYNWGTASPGAGIPGGDNFSARFRGSFRFEPGRYRFKGEVNDGIRVWIDRVLALDEWHDHAEPETLQFDKDLSAGLHEVRVDYYEASGTAAVTLEWERTGPQGDVLFLPLLLR